MRPMTRIDNMLEQLDNLRASLITLKLDIADREARVRSELYYRNVDGNGTVVNPTPYEGPTDR